MTDAAAPPLSGRTAWARNLETPLRQFLRTQTGSAAVLLAATVAALVWANVDAHSYATVWHARLELRSTARWKQRTDSSGSAATPTPSR